MSLSDTDDLIPHIDQRLFRETMGRFVTGVAVASTLDRDGAPVGVTVNSFTSVSINPPMVLFCLDRKASTLPAFVDSRHFAVNVLAADQVDLCDRFARRPGDWQGIRLETWETGAPVIADCVAAVDCTLAHLHDGGDHRILLGRVMRLGRLRDVEPLVYHRGAFAHLDRRRRPAPSPESGRPDRT
jgi:flavin reductase (DIM6/NTAB) family NADH-FMN oxidoreductase RutF